MTLKGKKKNCQTQVRDPGSQLVPSPKRCPESREPKQSISQDMIHSVVDVFQQASSGLQGSRWSPPSSDCTLTGQSCKEICWFALDLFRDKEYVWEKKQEYPYFWKGYSPAQNLINGCSTLKSGSCNIVENWSRLCIILCTDKILILRLRRKKLPGSS